ncbi:U3 small nucleolar ribonucleoprotein IMP4 [Nematocida homosporus]|uniref:U3 small nucleolar ribonucleoprotein IMP4 n=1 Tax=Nematocida homosporus TaxID=1912981 RepID=UPI0022204A02|nr:U3 small nucleolar ribonucleoprotein IMP4 [Nematocida homosporus]KAI5187004.1 U3 small nucleolar ribonucleoprotein IMP4 [Nematocida homosporus]
MISRRIRRERKEWLDTARSEERRVAAKKRRDQLYAAYEREAVVPKEIRHEIAEGKLTAEEALQEAIYASGELEKEDEFTNQEEPRPIITTSRSPSDPLTRFAKMLKHLFPNAEKINRGKHMMKELVTMAIEKGHTDLIMVNEHKGNPSSLVISHLPHGPTAYFSLHHVVTTETESSSGANPALIFDNLTTPLGLRIKRILSSLFPALTPREKPKKIVAFVNREDSIFFSQYKSSFAQGIPTLEKISPSFTMKLYEIRAGTLEMDYADKEFVFRPYLNTARKKLYLGEELDDLN